MSLTQRSNFFPFFFSNFSTYNLYRIYCREEGNEWPKEIEDDIVSECRKFGNVLHAALIPESDGFIYLKFEAIDSARIAIKALNGRWFNRRMISAEPVPFAVYANKFPN